MRVLPLLLALSAPLAGQSGWRDLTGQPVPELQVEEWLNAEVEAPTAASLKGKVWLLEFFATWCMPCMGKVGRLSKLHDKYFDRGFRVVAVSSEPLDELKKAMVDKRKVKYWIGSDPDTVALQEFAQGGEVAIPRFCLVDAKGRVVGHELPDDAQIEALLQDVFDPELHRELHAELAAARGAYEMGAYGVAWRATAPLLAHAEPLVAADARFLRDKIESYSAFRERTGEQDLAGLKPPDAFALLLVQRCEFDGLAAGAWAEQRLRGLRQDESVAKHKQAWAKLEEAVARDVNSAGKPYERKRAQDLYGEVVKRFARTPPARVAERRLSRFAPAK